MDTTYFGRSFGVMVLMDSISQQALSVDAVKYETNALYAAALNELREKGVEIQSIVCDGRKGLLQLFPEIPAQLCPVSPGQNCQPLPDAQPENGRWQGVVAPGTKAEAERQGRLSKRPTGVV